MYIDSVKFNKPGSIPQDLSTNIKNGWPFDYGFCPEHEQRMCLALIQANSAYHLNYPICFANSGIGLSLTLKQVNKQLDRFVGT
jgi:hypothetical protein